MKNKHWHFFVGLLFLLVNLLSFVSYNNLFAKNETANVSTPNRFYKQPQSGTMLQQPSASISDLNTKDGYKTKAYTENIESLKPTLSGNRKKIEAAITVNVPMGYSATASNLTGNQKSSISEKNEDVPMSEPIKKINEPVERALPVNQKREVVSIIKEETVKLETPAVKDVENVQSVEYYVKKGNSVQENYVGAAQKSANGTWSLNVDAQNRLPNGNYELSGKVKSKDGLIQTDIVKLNVAINENGTNVKEQSAVIGELKLDESVNTNVVFQSPKELGTISNEFKVENVALIESSIKSTDNYDDNSTRTAKKELKLSGKATPNSFVTIYIYSNSPIVVNVKTDENGNWTYVLDKNLEDGNHEAYVAVTDSTGKITAKSEPLHFVKTAEAATMVAPDTAQQIMQAKSPVERSKNSFISFAIVVMVIFLSISLSLIGIVGYSKSKQ